MREHTLSFKQSQSTYSYEHVYQILYKIDLFSNEII